MRSIVLRLLAASLGVLLALAAAEVALRLFDQPEVLPTASTEETRASTSRFPDFRKRVYRIEKEPSTFRILILGDSFSWGWGVNRDQVYAERLRRWLPKLESDYRFEVVNWSRPGWNTWEEWLSIRDQLADWRPDLVILGYVFNDAEPTNLRERERGRVDLVRRIPRSGIGSLLYTHSRVARRLWNAVENRRMRRTLTAYYHGLYETSGWIQTQRGLRRLRGAAAELGIPLLVVIFPIFDSQLDDAYAYRELHALVAETARRMKIRCLDLLPSYDGIDARKLAVVPFTDAHPSPLAHRIAAAAILDYLIDEELIPARKTQTDSQPSDS